MIRSMRGFILVFLFSFYVGNNSNVWAQACFSATGLNTVGCVPFTVTLDNCSNLPTIVYSFLGDFSLNKTSIPTYTYTAPGIYTIIQLGNLPNGSGTDSIIKKNYITVYAQPDPQVRIRSCDGGVAKFYVSGPYQKYKIDYGDGGTPETILAGQIGTHTYVGLNARNVSVEGIYVPGDCPKQAKISQSFTPNPNLVKPIFRKLYMFNKTATTADIGLEFDAFPYFRYEIHKKTNQSGTFQKIADISGVSGVAKYTVKSNSIFNTTNCFKIVVADTCGNSLSSETLCNLSLSATVKNQTNLLLWGGTVLESLNSFTLWANGNSIVGYNLTNYTSSFDHTGLICNQKYCYVAEAAYDPNGSKTFSDTVCVKAISNNIPPSVTQLLSTVTAQFPTLNWRYPGTVLSKKVTLERSSDNVTYAVIDTASFLYFEDKKVMAANESYFYRLFYQDSCGNVSGYSKVTKPIRLYVGPSIGNNDISLVWTDYVGFTVKEYEIEKLDANGIVFLTLNVGRAKGFSEVNKDTLTQKIIYRVKAIPTDASLGYTYSNTIEVILKPKIYVPNAFTPNGDGLNDIFIAKQLFISQLNMSVYNAYGEGIFSTDDKTKGWDGKVGGVDAPIGVYTYTIDASDAFGTKISKRGTVTLMK